MAILGNLNCCSLICVIVIVHATTVKRGVVFKNDQTVSFASDSHLLIVSLNAAVLRQQIVNLFTHVHKLETQLGNAGVDPAVLQARQMLKGTSIVLEISFTALDSFVISKGSRSKRSSNWLGSIVGGLFGLTTNDELRQLETALTSEAGQVHTKINDLVSHLRITDEHIKILTKTTNRAQEALRKIEGEINSSRDDIDRIERDILLIQSTTQLATAANDLTLRIDTVIEQIQSVIIAEEMSPTFLNPTRFVELLKGLHETVPLLFAPVMSNIAEYYKISQVEIKQKGSHFYFFLCIPIRNEDSNFKLFSTRSMWTQNPNSKIATKIKISQSYIAINQADSLAVVMPDLTHCKVGKNHVVCKPRYVFVSAEGSECLFDIYLGKSAFVHSCQILTRTAFEKEIINVGGNWIVSTSKELEIKETCDSVTVSKSIPRGLSVLPHSPCSIQGHDFKLKNQRQRPKSQIRINYSPALNIDVTPIDFNSTSTMLHLNLSKIDFVPPDHLALLSSHVHLLTSHERLHWGVLGGSTLLTLIMILVGLRMLIVCVRGPFRGWFSCRKGKGSGKDNTKIEIVIPLQEIDPGQTEEGNLPPGAESLPMEQEIEKVPLPTVRQVQQRMQQTTVHKKGPM